jgi:hypothetical protein
MPNMDFVVRECRAVVDGQMAVVRLGTCGSLRAAAQLGSLVVADHAVCVRRDPDAFTAGDGRPFYNVGGAECDQYSLEPSNSSWKLCLMRCHVSCLMGVRRVASAAATDQQRSYGR